MLRSIVVIAFAVPMFASAQVATPSNVEQQICAQLQNDAAASGKVITDCAIDLDAKKATVAGDGLRELDIAAMCSRTMAIVPTTFPFTIELKNANAALSAREVCRVTKAPSG